jgi:hypothetical protein
MLSMSTFFSFKAFHFTAHNLEYIHLAHFAFIVKVLVIALSKVFLSVQIFQQKNVNTCELRTPVLRTNIERLLLFDRSMIFLMSVYSNGILECTMRSRNINDIKINFRIQTETKLVFFQSQLCRAELCSNVFTRTRLNVSG